MNARLIRWVILDRDGVINQDSDNYVRSPDEWIPLPGSIEAIARLSQAGLPVTVATNQSGLARGYFDEAALEAMHDKLYELVEAAGGQIDALAFCPHGPDDGCDCRKPAPGLIKALAQAMDMDPAQAIVIGDSLRDLQAGQACGCQLALVRTGKGRKSEAALADSGLDQVAVYNDLREAVEALLSQR